VRSLIVNASEGGMFIALDPPPDVGTQLVIEIPASAGEPAMVVAGRVARRVLAPLGAPMPSGVGVEIANRTPEWLGFCTRLAAKSAGR
jgi:hypothetical protein